VHPLLPSGKPDFSRVIACECTRKELDKGRQSRLQHYSNLGSLTRFTFDNLDPQGRSGNPKSQEQFSHIYKAARVFAAEPEGWLILIGPSGCGKTHLAAAITNERINGGHPAFYITTSDLLDHLRSAFAPKSEMPYDEFFDQVPTVIVTVTPVGQLDERLQTRLTDPKLCQVHVIEEKQPSLEYGWGPEYELQKSMTFSSFDWRRVNLPPEQRENLEEAFRLAFDFAKSPEGWLVFMGDTGCGKTHLAAAIVNYRYQADKPALFTVVPEFLDHLRSTFSPESKSSYDQLFESVKTAPLLILDDFGEQSTTPWAREKLYQVINYRYNARLAIVITTRYSLEEIYEKIDSSISSRLVDSKISTPYNIMAPDYRGDVRPSQKKIPRGGRKGR